MAAYAARRVLIAAPILWAITVLAFALLSLAPGDAVDALVLSRGQGRLVLSGADLQNLKHQYGLDQPLPLRYLVWLGQVVRGNLGFRVSDGYSVALLVADRLPRTLELMGAAMLVGLLIGLPLGLYSALRQYSVADYVLTVFAFLGVSVPSFFAAIGALYVFAVWLHLLPVAGYVTPGRAPSLADELYHLILPASVLALEFVAGFMRYARASMLEVLREEYVMTARAKGLAERVVIMRHAFRNALLPIITVVGLSLPNLIAGAVIIESLFNWPGLGQLYFTAIGERDYPSMMAMVLLSGTMVLFSSLLADLAYAVVDPRIRYSR
jgi:peptide/nickel transport system permease protein